MYVHIYERHALHEQSVRLCCFSFDGWDYYLIYVEGTSMASWPNTVNCPVLLMSLTRQLNTGHKWVRGVLANSLQYKIEV